MFKEILSNKSQGNLIFQSKHTNGSNTKIECSTRFIKLERLEIQVIRAVIALKTTHVSNVEREVRYVAEDQSNNLIDVIKGQANDGFVYLDVTNELQDILNLNKALIELTIQGDAQNYYTFLDNECKLHIEYSYKNDENLDSAYLSINQSKAGSGNINLATGRLTFAFNDTVLGNSTLPIVVSHHYNVSFAGDFIYHCGCGWKLNCQQYLKKNKIDFSENKKTSTKYTWINAEGKEVAFYEKYYYLDYNKKRHYVPTSEVKLDVNGNYSTEDGEAIVKECVSASGLILEAEPENVKNKDLFYTSTEEIASLEQRLKAINDSIEQINDNKASIKLSFVNSLNSIVCQIKQTVAGYSLKELEGNNPIDTERKAKAGDLITSLNAFLNDSESISFTFDMDDSSINSKKSNLIDKILDAYRNAYNFYLFVINHTIFSLETKLHTLSVFFESIISSLSATTKQYDEQLANLTKQEDKYKKQIFQYKEQLKIYRKNQPTCFIKDGDLVYGFGDATEENLMRLILITDSSNNYIHYTYDRNDNLVRIDSSSGDYVTLHYDQYVYRLSSIVESNGRKIDYYYDSNECLVVANGNQFFYNNDRRLSGIKSINETMGVGFKYLDYERISQIYGLQKYKSINNGEMVELLKNEIEPSDKVTFNNVTFKKHHPINIKYYDYKSVAVSVSDEFTGKSKTYLFDNGGRLTAQYDGCYEDAQQGKNTTGVKYQRINKDLSFEAIQQEWAEELATGTNMPNADKTISQVLPSESIQKIKDNKMDCLVFSGWAQADSPWIKTNVETNVNTVSISMDEDDELTGLVLSNIDGRENRKFELRIELTFTNDTSTYTRSYNLSFDWLNTQWQYCALPIKLSEDDRNKLQSIKLVFDYSNNYGYAQFFGFSLKEGSWQANTKSYDNIYSENSSTSFRTCYSYDENNLLEKVEKRTTLLGDERGTKFITYKYYTPEGLIAKNIDPDGMVTEYVYDKLGNVIKEMMYHKDEPANKFITEYIVNKDGTQTESVNALGGKIVTFYDIHGNLKEQTDYLGNKVSFGFEDTLGNLANITATVNGKTSSNENVYVNDLLIKTKHNGCVYEFDYDGEGRKTAVKINGELYCTIAYEGKDIQTVTYANNEQVKKEILKDGKSCKIYSAPVGEKIDDFIVVEYDKTIVNNEKDTRSYKEQIKDRTTTGEKITYETQYDKKGRIAEIEVKGSDYGDKLLVSNSYGFENALEQQTVKIGKTVIDTEKRMYKYGFTNKLLSIEHENAFTEIPVLDKLGRVSSVDKGKIFKDETDKDCFKRIVSKRYNYLQNGEKATTLIASETFGEQGQKSCELSYTYDKNGNITEIRENDKLVSRYEYDSLNRLVREDNKALNKSTFFTYDSAGNIAQRNESTFTLGLSDTVEKTVVGSYVYADNGVMDKLLSYNGENITYNELGNPTIYHGKELTWSFINRLASFGDVSFKYNYAGTRLFKTVGDKTTKYYCDGAKVIAQDDGTDMLYFYYGTEGVTAFKYNGAVYHYKKDMLGNILGIYDANGQLLVKYVYDAWGNHKTFAVANGEVDISGRTAYTESDDTATKVAILNPFRYRSYYFDIETGLYYLQTRYYDPETGRFISMDDISYLDPESIHGLNLYAYCGNNPVIYADPSGHWIETVFDLFSLGASFVEVVINPANPWAWAGLVGDAVDLLPFVTGVGEGVRATKMVKYADDVIDASYETIKFVKAADMVDDFSDAGRMLNKFDHVDDYYKFTVSNLSDGKTIHKLFMNNGGPIFGTRLRADGLNDVMKTIFELKPYNIRNARKGVKQILKYNDALGGGYKMIIVFY